MIIGDTDRELLLALNSFVGRHALSDKILTGLANNELIRGFPIFFSLVALWFSVESIERRSRMLTGLLATCVATVLSVWLQYHITPHIRPFLDPAFHLNIIDPRVTNNFGRLGSFPSDTATLYFSLATVVLLENRLAGSLCFFWALVTVGIGRVAFGWHYPSDIVGSLVLGPGCVYLFHTLRRSLSVRLSCLKVVCILCMRSYSFFWRTHIICSIVCKVSLKQLSLFFEVKQLAVLSRCALKK